MSCSKRLKICHVASGDLWAGAEVQIFNIVAGLMRYGHFEQFAIVMNRGRLYDELTKMKVCTNLIDEKENRFFEQLGKMVSFVRKNDIDIIHSHRYKENILSCLANLLLSKKCKLIKTQHSSVKSPSTWRLRVYHNIDLMLTKIFFSRLIVVSRDICDEFVKFIPRKKICVVHNSINPEKYDLQCLSSCMAKQLRIGIAGRLVPIKNIEEFVKIAVHLKRGGYISKAFIAGSGPLEKELKDLCIKNGAERYIIFLGHIDDISLFFKNIDVLFITSHHEGIPTVLLEGMYFGKIIIARRTGGIPEVLKHGYNGLLYDDSTEAVALIKKISSKTLNCDSMRRNARKTIENSYINRYQASKYASVYRSL